MDPQQDEQFIKYDREHNCYNDIADMMLFAVLRLIDQAERTGAEDGGGQKTELFH